MDTGAIGRRDGYADPRLDLQRAQHLLDEAGLQLEAAGATGVIFGTSGYDVARELRAYAEVAALR